MGRSTNRVILHARVLETPTAVKGERFLLVAFAQPNDTTSPHGEIAVDATNAAPSLLRFNRGDSVLVIGALRTAITGEQVLNAHVIQPLIPTSAVE